MKKTSYSFRMISKKGFTLFEILIVITIMAIISIAAMTSSINTQRQFVFINTFKELLMKVREARLYTVTQKSVDLVGAGNLEDMGIPSAYGIHIQSDGSNIVTTVFADLAATGNQNKFDQDSDVIIGAPYSLDAEKYTLTLGNVSAAPVDLTDISKSLTLLYPPGEIKVIASYFDGANQIPITNSSIDLALQDNQSPDLTKNIFIFLRSGIAEDYVNPSP